MSSSLNSSSSSETVNLPTDVYGWLMDVPCPVDFVLGTTTVKVRDFAAFGPNAAKSRTLTVVVPSTKSTGQGTSISQPYVSTGRLIVSELDDEF